MAVFGSVGLTWKKSLFHCNRLIFLSQAFFISWLNCRLGVKILDCAIEGLRGKRALKLVTILPLEFKFIQKTVYFGLQFCYLVRKFCIQIWNFVSDTIKSLYAFYNCEFREIGNDKATLFTPQCTWRDLCLILLRDLIIEMKNSQMHRHHFQGGILRTMFQPVPLHCIPHFHNCSKDP